jgi:hypothetical protein
LPEENQRGDEIADGESRPPIGMRLGLGQQGASKRGADGKDQSRSEHSAKAFRRSLGSAGMVDRTADHRVVRES